MNKFDYNIADKNITKIVKTTKAVKFDAIKLLKLHNPITLKWNEYRKLMIMFLN